LLFFGAEYFVFQFAIKNLKIKLYKTIILPVVLYGCETWLLTVKEELRVRVFENRVLRGTRLQGSEETYIKRGLIYSAAHPIYSAGDQIEKIEMGGACSTYGGSERRIQGLCVETRGKDKTGKTLA